MAAVALGKLGCAFSSLLHFLALENLLFLLVHIFLCLLVFFPCIRRSLFFSFFSLSSLSFLNNGQLLLFFGGGGGTISGYMLRYHTTPHSTTQHLRYYYLLLTTISSLQKCGL